MTESSLVVRDARPDEWAAIRDLTFSAYDQYATIMGPTAWTKLQAAIDGALSVDHGVERLVAEMDGTLVGSVMLFSPAVEAYGKSAPRSRSPEIRALAVAPSTRGLGVGRLLVSECIRRAREGGADAIGLHTSHSMRQAIMLYETFGFTRDPSLDIHIEGAEPIEAYRLPL